VTGLVVSLVHRNAFLVVLAVDKELYKTALGGDVKVGPGYEAGAKHAQSNLGVK